METASSLDKPEEGRPGNDPMEDVSNDYKELASLDDVDMVENFEPFDCRLCFMSFQPHDGIVLRDCLHAFCKPCLISTIENCTAAEIRCPYEDNVYSCESVMQHREIKALVGNDKFEAHLGKSIQQAENVIDAPTYVELANLDDVDMVENIAPFDCRLCFMSFQPHDGIVLRDCLHAFCKPCLISTIENCTEAEIRCPYEDNVYSCESVMQHREIKALVGNDKFEAHLGKSIQQAEYVINAPIYVELANLDDVDMVENIEPFECPICFVPIEPQDGIVLRDCLHSLCKQCLIGTVQHCNEAEIRCPYRNNVYGCDSIIQLREIRAVVSRNLYETHLSRSIKQAEGAMQDTFHCQTPDCPVWCILDGCGGQFQCPSCNSVNCLNCKAIHAGFDCQAYQKFKEINDDSNPDVKLNKVHLLQLLANGSAMNCPGCNIVLMKQTGCDGLVCSICKTDICWATRGRRWGLRGHGDTSGGCRCGVDGRKCHPTCGNCH